MDAEEKRELEACGYEPRETDAERIELDPPMPKPWVVFQEENVLVCYVCKTYQLLSNEALEIGNLQAVLNRFSEAHRPCLDSIARISQTVKRSDLKEHEPKLIEALQSAAVLYLEYTKQKGLATERHIFEHATLGRFEISFRLEGTKRLPEVKLAADHPKIAALKARIKALMPLARAATSYGYGVSCNTRERWKKILKNERKLWAAERPVIKIKSKRKKRRRTTVDKNHDYSWAGS